MLCYTNARPLLHTQSPVPSVSPLHCAIRPARPRARRSDAQRAEGPAPILYMYNCIFYRTARVYYILRAGELGLQPLTQDYFLKESPGLNKLAPFSKNPSVFFKVLRPLLPILPRELALRMALVGRLGADAAAFLGDDPATMAATWRGGQPNQLKLDVSAAIFVRIHIRSTVVYYSCTIHVEISHRSCDNADDGPDNDDHPNTIVRA
eukprot:SAG22_NODE_637_length_8315_cov_16.174416_5_plen_207_part_00